MNQIYKAAKLIYNSLINIGILLRPKNKRWYQILFSKWWIERSAIIPIYWFRTATLNILIQLVHRVICTA